MVNNRAVIAVLNASRGQPRLILRALRRVENIVAWCEARRQGRLRSSQEILRQQAKAVSTLNILAAEDALIH